MITSMLEKGRGSIVIQGATGLKNKLVKESFVVNESKVKMEMQNPPEITCRSL
jgi:hypothetical protein